MGDRPAEVLDDRFVDVYSVAGNIDDCAAAIAHFGKIGITELILTFVGSQPIVDMAYLASGLKEVA